MTKHGIRWTFLIGAFAFGALAPLFAQEGPKDRELPAHQSSLHSLMAGFTRTINTVEVAYYIQNRSYASWKSLLENHEQKYLNGWLAQFYPQFYPEAAKTDFRHTARGIARSKSTTECRTGWAKLHRLGGGCER